jgi:hypothetical protein
MSEWFSIKDQERERKIAKVLKIIFIMAWLLIGLFHFYLIQSFYFLEIELKEESLSRSSSNEEILILNTNFVVDNEHWNLFTLNDLDIQFSLHINGTLLFKDILHLDILYPPIQFPLEFYLNITSLSEYQKQLLYNFTSLEFSYYLEFSYSFYRIGIEKALTYNYSEVIL